MTTEQFERAKPFINELQPIDDMIDKIKKSMPSLELKWGTDILRLDSLVVQILIGH